MKANSMIDGATYSVFQLDHHWPQDDANEWFHQALIDGVIESVNMGKYHNPNEPATIKFLKQEVLMTATTGDWVLKAEDGEIFALTTDDFDVMFSLEDSDGKTRP